MANLQDSELFRKLQEEQHGNPKLSNALTQFRRQFGEYLRAKGSEETRSPRASRPRVTIFKHAPKR